MTRAETILDYWFNGLDDQCAIDPEAPTVKRWFLGDEETDREIRERFGRFPHRNAILGRRSTPEEAEFLKRPDSFS